MTAPRVRVRFAPSPTGELHAGNADPFAALIKRIDERTGMRGKKLYLPIRAA